MYDCALEGGVSAGVPVGGECAVAVVFNIGPAEVAAVAWLGGIWLGGELVAR